MAERGRLADRETEEALRRSLTSAAAGPDPDGVAAMRSLQPGVTASLEGAGRPAGLGLGARGMSPMTLMAMQRLAGNRATVHAMAPRPRTDARLDVSRLPEDEEVIGGGEGGETGESLAMANEADTVAGTSGSASGAGGGGDGAGAGGGGTGEETPPGSGLNGAGGTSGDAKAGKVAGGAKSGKLAGGTAGGAPRKKPPPPIVTGGGAGSGGDGTGSGGGVAATTEAAAGEAGAAVSGGPAAANRKPAPAPAAGEPPGANLGTDQGAPAPGTAPAPATGPAPAPAAAPATGPGGLPDPATASTGIDWAKILADYGPPARTVFELTRIIPGWGLLGGLAADSINFASDIAAIPNSENAEFATVLIVFRNVVNIGNNGLGHVLYVNQLIQDGLAGSVVGSEFVPLTAAVNEVLSGVKVALDEVVMGTDILVEVEALYQSNHAPTSAEAEQWQALADGYAANILGDVVNLVLDIISLSSAGAANTAPVQQGRQPLTLAAAYMRNAAPNIISAVNGVLGVWLGTLITEGRHAYVGSPSELRDQALVLDAAGLIVDAEGPRARMTYDGINLVVDALEAYAENQIAQINMVAEALSGGKSAFELIRDAVRDGLDDMNRKLGMVQQLGAAASNGQANAAAISAACATVLGALDELVLPDVTLPSVELGEGIIADTAEAIANQAAEAANIAIRQSMASVSAAIETAKDTIRGPVEAVQERADGFGEWLAILAQQCTAMAGTLGGHIATFSEGLGRCTNIEQVIDLIIGQVSELTGMPRFTVQEIRDLWNSVGPAIDRFIALGPRMHERASDLRAHADQLESGGATEGEGGPITALPPEPPPNPDEAAAAMAAVA